MRRVRRTYRDLDRPGRWLHQELLAEGRYDETRGGRRHAYTGRHRLDGDRIDYLDDSGFYAIGSFLGEELYHAEFVMRHGGGGRGTPPAR
ncbi:Atu4866 domain-containing protein [Actinoplanes utahensis]|uniref:Uncharacterized protein n=1 Tax=Actinoplanes utahensis TaxID=1869 RepID=A0A0A6USB2_ACTUT|nr:Atu4866 domain-containing protein [Actinoplanes utahensis]KHD77873.1 hypothetical protein MB27_08820 [Actinoplanes utahensis]GIF32439.1 hypothetical protein Aut01nite_54250 [Actinoplanes utahensis]